jgi:hypothetical protein
LEKRRGLLGKALGPATMTGFWLAQANFHGSWTPTHVNKTILV